MRPAVFLTLAALTGGLFADPAAAAVPGFKVTTDQSIDASSLETIVKEVIERSGAKTNDEKAIAIYEYLHNSIFHHAYATEKAPQSVGPLKVLNAYGWGLCGGQHTVMKALYETAGWECRYVGWPGHTTVEVKYDGKWHYFDVFLKCYYWSKDKSHIASQEEIAADPSIVLDAVKDGRAARQNLCCGDEPAGVVEGCKKREVVGDSKGWASVTWRDEKYSPLLTLPAGGSVRLDWKGEAGAFAVDEKNPAHTCGIKDFREDKVLGPVIEHYGARNWSSGAFTYAPDFAKASDLADVLLTGAEVKNGKVVASAGKGVAVFKLPLPYPYVSATATPKFEGGDGKLFVSGDAGKTWQPTTGSDLSALVKQQYDVWLKVEFPQALTGFHLDAVVEHNRGVLPFLRNGKNVVTVTADKGELPDNAVLRVTYVYQEATVANPDKRKRYDGQGITYAAPKTVTKDVTKVPTTFEIVVEGNTPPKMLSLERTVVGK
jgi:hypothetical protein